MNLAPGIEERKGRFRVSKRVRGQLVRRTFETLEEAERFHRQLSSESQRAAATASSAITVAELVTRWFEGRRGRLTPGAIRDYEAAIGKHVTRIGDTLASELSRNPLLLRTFYDSVPPVRALRVHTILKQAFDDAVHNEDVPRNPCLIVRPARPKTKEKLVPGRDEVEKLVVVAGEESALWGVFVYIVATLGLRRGEACALRWEDIDFDLRVVHVRRSACRAKDKLIVKAPKSGVARRLPVGAAFLDRLRPFREPDGYIFKGFTRGYWKGGDPSERCWHPDFAGHRFEKLRDGLEMPQYTLHSLRHFVAVQLLVKGKPVTQVARFMGHANASITQDLYPNHVHEDALRDVGETATDLFDG